MLISQSALAGSNWAEIMVPCTAWQARPAWRYDGSFVAETAHPILFLSNTYDGITPIRNAFLMAEGFAGSAILQQDSIGHSSYSSPSMCTGMAVRAYFQTGELPAPSHGKSTAFCEPDLLPLQGYGLGVKPKPPRGVSDLALWEALVTLNQVWP